MNKQLGAVITVVALALSSFEARAAEYEIRMLDPLPDGFVPSGLIPEFPRLFGPNIHGDFGENLRNENPITTFAFRWNYDGELHILDVPDGTRFSAGYEINKRGDIVGWYAVDDEPVIAAIWHKVGTRTDLSNLGLGAQAYGINDKGDAVGHSVSAENVDQPVVWDKFGRITALPLPEDTISGTARSINDREVIIGVAQPSDIDLAPITVLWCRVGSC